MASERTFPDRIQRGTELAAAVELMTPSYAPPNPKFALAAPTAAVGTAETCNTAVETIRIPSRTAVRIIIKGQPFRHNSN